MDQQLKRLRKISAFAAYNGLQRTPKSISSPLIDLAGDEAGKKKKKDRSHLSAERPRNQEKSGNSSSNGDLASANSERLKKKKGKKRKSANSQATMEPSIVNGAANGPSSQKRQKLQTDLLEKISVPSPVSETSSQRNGKDQRNQMTNGVWKILNTLTYANSADDARDAFAWLIDPMPIGEFFEQYWEKKPLHLPRRSRSYYDGLFSTDALDSCLREHDVQYTVNLDITKYENGERKTLNPSGRAYASTVWNFYKDGCSVRLLNPQSYSETVWKLNSTLQEFFGTLVGANLYLTPEKTQGFAPHYDDIEAFVVQLEGVKRWRIYKPRNGEETLPRFSSKNFGRNEIGKPIMEVELRPGDLLYFPRGFIHEAVASNEEHSLHLTISTTQRNSWGDYLQMVLEQAVQAAMLENIEYRRALPLNYMDVTGTVNMDRKKKGRKDFVEKAKQLLTGLIDYASVDSAADQMAKEKFMQDCLPPCLTDEEKRRTIQVRRKDSPVAFTENTKVRLLRKHCLRLVMENESSVSVYYNTENGRVYREKELQHFVVENDLAPGVDYLIEHYPRYVPIKELPLESASEKVKICELLFGKSLLMIE